jgi:hypothetical protein
VEEEEDEYPIRDDSIDPYARLVLVPSLPEVTFDDIEDDARIGEHIYL